MLWLLARLLVGSRPRLARRRGRLLALDAAAEARCEAESVSCLDAHGGHDAGARSLLALEGGVIVNLKITNYTVELIIKRY